MRLDIRWLVVGLALLCLAEVWSKPTAGEEEDKEFLDDEETREANDDPDKDGDDSDDDNQSLPVQALTKSKIFTVTPGSTVYLPCEFLNADNVMISWMKCTQTCEQPDMLYAGDAKIGSDPQIDRLANNTLVIRNVAAENSSSEYICEALVSQQNREMIRHQIRVSPAGGDTSHMVRVLPSEHEEVEQGSSLTLGCEYLGSLEPRGMFWSRQGHRIKVDRETAKGVYLDIKDANRHLAGDYQCLIEIGSDKPLIQHLKLRVRHKPEIEYEKEHLSDSKTRERSHYYTGMGVESNLTCVVHAHPPVERLHWLKDGRELETEEGGRLSKSVSRKSHHVLTIKNTSKSDLGAYRCRAWSELGDALGPEIDLRDTPDQPIFKKGEAVDDSIVFQWRVNSYKPIVEAQLLYRKEGEDEWLEGKEVDIVSTIGKEKIVQTRITGIEAGNYEAKLRARNDEEHPKGDRLGEWGPYSELKKFDGEYKSDVEAETVKDSGVTSTFSAMTLLVVILPLVFSWEL
ncbi:uncharacterized protein LOC106639752 [Copidosoma floridanum]|uniref:uncharacterized protein LOC106639752 n=1 Tax=Copidosoma floridanum TaxID=29053 RepID=UPI0006C9CC28|nr:uncharacterized protein LOC106639752 [Copidosoma floridanum]